MGRKGSEISPSKRYPLRSTHSSGSVLRSATNKSNTACSDPLNNSAPAQPTVRKRKSGSSSVSPNTSVRVLRSASKNKVDLFREDLNDNIPSKPDAKKRKGARPSKAASPINSVRVLRSASKNKEDACSKTLNDSTVAQPSAAQPSAEKRKSGSPLKVGNPVSRARVLRSNSKRTNETFKEPINNSTDAQPASRKRKSNTHPREVSPKLGVRVLRSASKKKDACVEAQNVSTPVQPAGKKRKSAGSSKEHSPRKDYLKICQRFRYILNRMNYEQSLIQAYAGDGWKGQSSEKIKPEKELERAKAEILRCKIRIREAFRNMDVLLSEGKLEESLFDSAGEIFSEDIFCAICGSKDVTLKNDIILCDGACDRGFHQNCLSPPLRTEDIPPGNEGWFCPACVCKIDCIDALNELQGSKLSVHDSWEKVFPEAASMTNGSKQCDASVLPLGDSEDNDYNSAFGKGHMMMGGRSSAEDDEFDSSNNARTVGGLGLPSDDSEDDDFDPAGPDSSEDQKSESTSEESDFTSDSDDFCAEIAKSRGQDEVSVSPFSNINEEICNRAFMETELDQDVVLPVSSRRQLERLDYKKLYDEAFGEESYSSSDDEVWSGEENLYDSETDGSVRLAKPRSRTASTGHPNSQHTPQRGRHYGSVSEQQAEFFHSSGSNSTTRHFGPIIRQKLKSHFEKEPYPSRATKESLAQELGLAFIQVDKWFASTRHSSRVAAAKKGNRIENNATGNNDGTVVDSTQVRVLNDEVLAEVAADRNGMVHEEVMLQNNLDEGNKGDILLCREESETEISSDPSDDKEWSGTSTSQKELRDTEIDSLAASNRAKRFARRAPVEPQNNEHTPLSKQLHGSVNDKQTEAPCSNGSSSKARKYHFGPVVSQRLKVHFEKDPYPIRSTVQSLAQELGLTFIQVRKWFSSYRHNSNVSAAKKGKDPGNHTNEKNDCAIVDSVQEKESNNLRMENPTEDRNDTVPRKFMLQINLNEGNDDNIMFSQHPSCEETVVTTPFAISREVGPPGFTPVQNQGVGALWSTGFEQGSLTTPTTVSMEDGPPGYGPGEKWGCGESWNNTSEQKVHTTPMTATKSMSGEVGPPGYGSGGNQGNWNTSFEQRFNMTPTTFSREACAPGYGPGEGQVSGASWNNISEQRVGTAPSTFSRQVGPPGYGPTESQVSGASWNTSTEQTVVVTPPATPREVGPPGYWPGENQGNGASWNYSREESVFTTPTTTTLNEVGPPGYWPQENKGNCPPGYSPQENKGNGPPGYWPQENKDNCPPGYWPQENKGNGPPGYSAQENKGNGASTNVASPMGRSPEKPELVDEARKKAIARELRRMKKFR